MATRWSPQVEMNYRVTPSGSLNWTCGIQYWTQINTTLNGAPVALSSVTYTFSDLGKNTKKILLLRSSGTVAAQASNGYQLCEGIDALTGNVLWGPLNQTIPKYHDIGFVGARNGTYVLRDKDTMEAYGYSLETGLQKWGPVKLPVNAWSYLATSGWLDNSRAYVIDYGGYVNALNLATGNIDWTWHTDDAGYNTPYGVYELWVQGQMAEVAGLIYVFEGKLYDPPMSANESIICLNATTGKLVWSGLGYDVKNVPAFADGYMVDYNSYDKQMYTYGKGPTATTATIENDVTTFGHKVVVKGMVTDKSAGTKDTDRVTRFPHGVPAVSEESMRLWMEYVYSQQVKPADATGVTVVVSVYDPNGNAYDVGTATSDGDGFYTLAFDPEVPGEYVVTARFAGSDSYWGSFAKTSVFVEEAPAATPQPTPEPATAADMYFLPVSIGMIVAIVIILVLLLLLLFRKR